MTPEDAVNRINKIFEEAVLQHGGDMTEVINYVKARLGTVAELAAPASPPCSRRRSRLRDTAPLSNLSKLMKSSRRADYRSDALIAANAFAPGQSSASPISFSGFFAVLSRACRSTGSSLR